MSGDHDKYGGCRTREEMRLVDEIYELNKLVDERDKRIAQLEAELGTCKWEHPEFGTEEKHTEVVFEQVTPSTYNGTSTKHCAIHGGIGRPCDCITCKLNSTQAQQ